MATFCHCVFESRSAALAVATGLALARFLRHHAVSVFLRGIQHRFALQLALILLNLALNHQLIVLNVPQLRVQLLCLRRVLRLLNLRW